MDTTPSQSSTDLIIENSRYREALERITACYPHEPGESYTMQRIAKDALRTTDDASRKAVEQYFRERGHDV